MEPSWQEAGRFELVTTMFALGVGAMYALAAWALGKPLTRARRLCGL